MAQENRCLKSFIEITSVSALPLKILTEQSNSHATTYILPTIPYKWNYWLVKYLAICLGNTIGGILN